MNGADKSVIVLGNITSIHSRRFIRHFTANGWRVRIISIQPPNAANRQEFGASIVNLPTYSIYNLLVKLPFFRYSQYHNSNSGVRWFEPYYIAALFTYIHLLFSIKHIVKQQNVQALFSLYLTMHGFLGALSGHRNLIAATIGGEVARYKWHTLKYWANHPAILRYTLNRSAKVIAGNQLCDEPILKERGCRTDNVVWLNHWGVEADKFAIDETSINNRSRKCRFICSRPFRADFDMENILRAFKILYNKRRDVELILATGARSEADLTLLYEQMEKTGCRELQCIEILTHMPYDDLPPLLSGCDVYIDPINIKKSPHTASWGVSGSLLEGMASGLIPVISRRPSIDWIMPDESYPFIFDDFTKDLPLALERAYFARHDMNLRAMLRESIVRKANWHKNLAKIEAMLLANR